MHHLIDSLTAKTCGLVHVPTKAQAVSGGILSLFLAPICGNSLAQVAVASFFLLSTLDVIAGVVVAFFLRHDFSSHEMREGIVRKFVNAVVICAASIVDTMLIVGLDLSAMPIPIPSGSVLVMFSASFCCMEMSSIAEIWAESHPEDHDSPIWQMLAHSKESLRGEGGGDGDA